jgi:hypothetical protein
MPVFIAAVLLMVGSASMGFKQGQANPDAPNLLQSNAHHIEQE